MTAPHGPATDSPRVQRALEALRRRGERVTPARCAVLRVIDAADGADEHLTAEQVGARVGELEPGIHRATVYRTLTALTDAGLLSHVHLGGSGTVYHLIDEPGPAGLPEPVGGEDHSGRSTGAYAAEPAAARDVHSHAHDHAHVQCVSCGRVLDVPPEALEPVAARLLTDLGFRLDTAHAALLGRCAGCTAGTGAAAVTGGAGGTGDGGGAADGPGGLDAADGPDGRDSAGARAAPDAADGADGRGAAGAPHADWVPGV